MSSTATVKTIPGFPHAPNGWSQAAAVASARTIGLEPGESHWEAVRALQEYFARHDDQPGIRMRELHDALEEKFHARGGMKYLYELFPGGPIHQGCQLAGLPVPAGSADLGFGSVQ
jgi:tRNA 2-thiouridine synthesizing protein E